MGKKIFFIFILFNVIAFHASMFGMNITDDVSDECTTSTGYIYTEKKGQWMYLSFTGTWNIINRDYTKYFSNFESADEDILDLTIKGSIFLKKSNTTFLIKYVPEYLKYIEKMRRKLLRFKVTKGLFIGLQGDNSKTHYIQITEIRKPDAEHIPPAVRFYWKTGPKIDQLSILGKWNGICPTTKQINIPNNIESCTLYFPLDPISLAALLPNNDLINIKLDFPEMKRELFMAFITRNSEKYLHVKINQKYYQVLNLNNTIKEIHPSISTEKINNSFCIFEYQGHLKNMLLDDSGTWIQEKNNKSFSYKATRCSLKITDSNSLEIQTPTKNITLSTPPTKKQLSALSEFITTEYDPLFMLAAEYIGKDKEGNSIWKSHYFYVTEIIKSSQLTVDATEADSESESETNSSSPQKQPTKESKKNMLQIDQPKPDTKSDNKNLVFGHTTFQIGLATATVAAIIAVVIHYYI